METLVPTSFRFSGQGSKCLCLLTRRLANMQLDSRSLSQMKLILPAVSQDNVHLDEKIVLLALNKLFMFKSSLSVTFDFRF